MRALTPYSHGSCSVSTTSGATPLRDMQSLVVAQKSRMREQNKNHLQSANQTEKHKDQISMVKNEYAHGVCGILTVVEKLSVLVDPIIGDNSVVIVVNKIQTSDKQHPVPAFLKIIMSHDCSFVRALKAHHKLWS